MRRDKLSILAGPSREKKNMRRNICLIGTSDSGYCFARRLGFGLGWEKLETGIWSSSMSKIDVSIHE